ncbi:MAG: glycosyltransferase family 2 protein [Candidatus Kryptoniota bacterium]
MSIILSIILVNYKNADITADCVRSIEQSTFRDFQIIIVDNESRPESLTKLKNACPNSIIIPQEENVGFAEGNNIGIRYALQSGSELILLLNNDTVVDKDMLRNLIETARKDSLIGIIGAKIFYHDSPDILWFAGGRFNIRKAVSAHDGMNQKDSDEFNFEKETDFITGCCLLTKKDVVEKIGLLDTRFFLYFEDSDFCVRAKKAGYSIIYQPKAVLYHKVSNTTEWDSPVYIYFNLRNKILFVLKHNSLLMQVLYLPYFLYFYTRQFVRLIFKHHNLRAARAAMIAVLDGLREYTGKFGEGSLHRL